jgi:hypothetical protein
VEDFQPGPPTEEQLDRQIQDYWGFEERRQFMLPDGVQYIEYKILTEGDKARYQKATNRELAISRNSGDAKLKTDPAEDRQALLRIAVVGWKMYRGRDSNGRPAEVPFGISQVRADGKMHTGRGDANFDLWLSMANPRIVEDLERDIRKANPWLLGDMEPEDIEKEIANLEEMLVVARERKEGKTSSGDR